MDNIKALIIQVNDNKNLGDVFQIARAEAMKIFKSPNKPEPVYITPSPFGYLVVVQNTEVVSVKART